MICVQTNTSKICEQFILSFSLGLGLVSSRGSGMLKVSNIPLIDSKKYFHEKQGWTDST